MISRGEVAKSRLFNLVAADQALLVLKSGTTGVSPCPRLAAFRSPLQLFGSNSAAKMSPSCSKEDTLNSTPVAEPASAVISTIMLLRSRENSAGSAALKKPPRLLTAAWRRSFSLFCSEFPPPQLIRELVDMASKAAFRLTDPETPSPTP